MTDDAMARAGAHRNARASAMADALNGLRSLVDPHHASPAAAASTASVDVAFAVVARSLGIALAPPPPGEGADGRVALLARVARVRTRAVRLTDDWWRHPAGPMLAWRADDGLPVAIVSRGATRYDLVDPVTGTRSRVDERLATAIRPDAVVVYRPLPEGRLCIPALLRAALTPTRADAVRLLAFALASALLALTVPVVTGMIMGTVIPAADPSRLLQLALALVVAACAEALLQLATAIAVLRMQGSVSAFLVPAVWSRLLSLPAAFFRRYTAGDLAVRMQSVEAMVRLVGSGAVVALLGVATSIVSLALIWIYSLAFGVIATVLLTALAVIVVLSSRAQLRRARTVEQTAGQLSGIAFELVSGIAKLRVAGAHEKAFQRWAERFSTRRAAQNDVRRAQNVVTVAIAVFPVAAAIVLFAAAGLIQPPIAGVGEFLAISAAFGQVVGAVASITAVTTQLLQAAPGMNRILPVIEELPEDDATKADPGVLSGAIEFSRVSFRYEKDGPLVLDDVSLSIRPGGSVALVGPSGSGKSTLARLLLGFEVPEEGGVYLDDQDLTGLDLRAVRRQLGVVLQTVEPLPGSILTNILGDALDLTIEDAWRAAEQVGLAGDIRAMPMGMHTTIGEGGSTLSGGQRQRLMIARALAPSPRILLLDEATSALDNVTQAVVTQSLASLAVTRVVVAHRLSTVMGADRIHYLERGRIVESGTFEELMAMEGAFAAQARRQLA
ncbi:MAG: NHLP bacteriocin export ABC transporter permease/ATPase subunit [Humibacter sp.]